MTTGAVSPTSDLDRFTQTLAAYERRIADLERAAMRGPLYSSGAGAPTGTGSAGQEYYDTTNKRLWRSNGSAWVFEHALDATKRAGVILSASSVTDATGVTVTLAWDGVVQNVDSWALSGGAGSNQLLTIPTGWDGTYIFTLRTAWGSSGLGTGATIWIEYNGGAFLQAAGPGAVGGLTCSGVGAGLAAGGTIACKAFQNSGVSVSVSAILVIEWMYR